MRIRAIATIIVGLVAGLCCAQPAAAQSAECPCNCYFSFDCPMSGSCFYGNLSIEDSCWWRQPKPQGQPGAGCEQNQTDWGWCDGICSTTARNTSFVNEDLQTVIKGVEAWGRAFTGQGLEGGGAPSIDWLKHVGQVEFNDSETSYRIWRLMMETVILARGWDALEMPEKDQPAPYNVAVAPLSRDTAAFTNGELAIKVLVAEMQEEGSGRRFIAEMNPDALDHELLGRICDGAPDYQTCIYWRLCDFADVMAMSNRGGAGGAAPGGERGGVSCKGCIADCEPDDEVNLFDLLAVIDDWGRTDIPLTDLDENGIVNLFDLLDLIDNWGRCAPVGPPPF